jgi:hypothetical protein
MSELDRWGESAATALLDDVTFEEAEDALAAMHDGGVRASGEHKRHVVLALAAAAVVALVAGVALVESRDTQEVQPPLATPPVTTPTPTAAPTLLPTTVPPAVPTTVALTQQPTLPPSTLSPTTEPLSTDVPPVDPSIGANPLFPHLGQLATGAVVPPLADQPDFGGVSKLVYAGGGVAVVAGMRQDGSPVLWKWSDGGGQWSAADLPGDSPFVPIVFTGPGVGYAFVDGYLQRTTDWGQGWTRIEIASPSGGRISGIDLAVGAGYVHLLAVDQDAEMTVRLYTMPIDGGSFTPAAVDFPPPAGGEPSASFAFDDRTGWMAITSRTLMGAAHFVNGEWTAAPEVTCVNGGIYFAASGAPGDFVRACDSGLMGSDGSLPEGTQLEVSSDGGHTYRSIPIPDRSPTTPAFVALLARPIPGVIVIRVEDGSAVAFDDDGGSARRLNLPPGSFVSELEARGGDIGVAIGSTSSGDEKVWTSTDVAVTWVG